MSLSETLCEYSIYCVCSLLLESVEEVNFWYNNNNFICIIFCVHTYIGINIMVRILTTTTMLFYLLIQETGKLFSF